MRKFLQFLFLIACKIEKESEKIKGDSDEHVQLYRGEKLKRAELIVSAVQKQDFEDQLG